MGYTDAVKFGFIRYFDFTTRSSRSEFWWWILFTFLVGVALVIVNSILFGPSIQQSDAGGTYVHFGGGVFGTIFEVVILIPTIAICCRRLHDTDKSGWRQLLAIIPIIGWCILLYWFVQPGEDGQNSFGANPLGSAA